jgi:pimeloyl-ACP methyl ester carboxylesterase
MWRVKEIKQPTLVIVGDHDHGSTTGVSRRLSAEALATENSQQYQMRLITIS